MYGSTFVCDEIDALTCVSCEGEYEGISTTVALVMVNYVAAAAQ